MRLRIYDWREGNRPNKKILDILSDNDWLEIHYKTNEIIYYLDINDNDIGKMLSIMTDQYDVAFMLDSFCVDQKGWKFRQR